MTKARIELPKPMLTALGELAIDGAVKSSAYAFLKTDLSRLNSAKGFKRAYHGLMCAQQCLGPLHPGYQKSLIEMRRTLNHYEDKFEKLAGIEDCEECSEARFDAEWDFWQSVLELVTPHMPDDARESLEQAAANFFFGEDSEDE